MPNLSNFTLADMTRCGAELRQLGEGCRSMEEAANRLVRHLFENLVDEETGEKNCAMVRFYKTHTYGELEADLQDFAADILGKTPESPTTKCLVLLGTVGEKEQWNSGVNSAGHRAIPLPSETVVDRFPMISQLVRQFGLKVGTLVDPSPSLLVDLEQRTYSVFYVPEALGSSYIPAQEDFVVPYRIRSVSGFGGLLPSASLFSIIMFSKVLIPQQTADLFSTVALNVKLAVLPFDDGRVFA
ncbi:MAG: hypothetical protein ACC628_14485 [Pirellulaceae bacterium]